MPFTVTQEDILTIRAEAAALPLEMTGTPTEGRAAQRLLAAGGSDLQAALRRQKFLAVGSAVSMEAPGRHRPLLRGLLPGGGGPAAGAAPGRRDPAACRHLGGMRDLSAARPRLF